MVAAVERAQLSGLRSLERRNDGEGNGYGFKEEEEGFKMDPRTLDFVKKRERNRREKIRVLFRRAPGIDRGERKDP